MKAIGLKSLVWSLLTAGLTLLTLAHGSAKVAELERLNPEITLAIGFFAMMLSGLAYRGFRIGMRSSTSLVVRRTEEKPVSGSLLFSVRGWDVYITRDHSIPFFEFSPLFLRLMLFAFFILMGSFCFGFRELDMLSHVAQAHYLGKPRYCPSEKAHKEVRKDRPECRLIYRAYELGYAKDLGKCGEDTEKQPEMCDLQMDDEPNLHFAYRVLSSKAGQFASFLATADAVKSEGNLTNNIHNFRPLLKDYFAQINNEPLAAHILLTNLPNPRGPLADKIYQIYIGGQCRTAYKDLPNIGPKVSTPADLNQAFAFAYSQLLFDSSYPTTVAHCEEFQIVWNVPESACRELPAHPEQTLAELNVEKRLTDVLRSYDRKKRLRPYLKFKKPEQFLSVNCLTIGELAGDLRQQVRFHDQALSYRWVGLALGGAPPSSIRMVRSTAHLMATDFVYTGLQSKAAFNADPRMDVSPEALSGDKFDFSRLGFLRDADVFLGVPWLELRPDLMEVYPYYLHLAHFVDTFRKEYRINRGRMQ